MALIINFQAVHPKEEVFVHLWDEAGNVWDIPGDSSDSLNFQFKIDIDSENRQNISFKFRFFGEISQWEPDDYVRSLPGLDMHEIWAFELSSRCMFEAPQATEAEQTDSEEDISPNRPEISDPEYEKKIKQKCKGQTKTGRACQSWAKPNGYCQRHGVEVVPERETLKTEKPEAEKLAVTPPPVETEICEAITAKGTACTLKVFANGRCKRHKGAPVTPPETTQKEGNIAVVNAPSEKEEKEIFEEFYPLFQKDFSLNNSSDRMNCEIACLYYEKLFIAIGNDDFEKVLQLDELFRKKLSDLSRIIRES